MKFIVSSKLLQTDVKRVLVKAQINEIITITLNDDLLEIGNETIWGSGKDSGQLTVTRVELWRLNKILETIEQQPITLVFNSKITIQSIII